MSSVKKRILSESTGRCHYLTQFPDGWPPRFNWQILAIYTHVQTNRTFRPFHTIKKDQLKINITQCCRGLINYLKKKKLNRYYPRALSLLFISRIFELSLRISSQRKYHVTAEKWYHLLFVLYQTNTFFTVKTLFQYSYL